MPSVITHAAEEKGKRKAEDAEPEGPKQQPEAPPTPEEELEAEARRAARDRLGGWMRLRLEALLLLETVLAEAEARAAGGGAQQQSLAAVQEDLRQVLLTAACETPTGSVYNSLWHLTLSQPVIALDNSDMPGLPQSTQAGCVSPESEAS